MVSPSLRARMLAGPLAKAKARQAARDITDWELAEKWLESSLFEKQRWLYEDRSRRIVAKVPRGGGKTTDILARGARLIKRTRRGRFLYIATSRTQGEILIWEPLKVLNEKMKLGLTFNETKMYARDPKTGGTFRVVGADDKREIEKLRGQPFHEVWIDEAASHPAPILEALILRIIGPRLGDFGGTLGMIGTPGHILGGLFYQASQPGLLNEEAGKPYSRPYADRFNPEFEGWDGWSYHTWTLPENTKAGHDTRGCSPDCQIPHMWEEALAEKRRQGWSDSHPIWRREYLAEWAADNQDSVYRYRPHLDDGTPWNQWEPKRDAAGFAIDALPKGHRWFYVYGADMGHKDPFALQVFAYSNTYPDLMHVYEFHRPGMYEKDIAELLKGEDCVKRIRAGETSVPADPTSVMGKTGYPVGAEADISNLGEAILGGLKRDYGIVFNPAPRSHGDKFAGIELFNGDLIEGRIKVMKGSELENQLQALQWTKNENGILKENKAQRNDCTDAAVYARRQALHQFQKAPIPQKPAADTREGLQLRENEALKKLERRYSNSDEPQMFFEDLEDTWLP